MMSPSVSHSSQSSRVSTEWLMAERRTLPEHTLHHRTHLVQAYETWLLRHQALQYHGQRSTPIPQAQIGSEMHQEVPGTNLHQTAESIAPSHHTAIIPTTPYQWRRGIPTYQNVGSLIKLQGSRCTAFGTFGHPN